MKCCINLTPSSWQVSLFSKTVGWRIYWYCREKLHVKQFFGVVFLEWKSKSRDEMYDRENQIFKSEIMFKKMFWKCFKISYFHLNSYSSAFIIRAALTQTIIILINILTRHELLLKDVVLNKFPLFFQSFLLIP